MNRTVTDTVALESPDDVALAERMKAGRERIVTELRKLIVGQNAFAYRRFAEQIRSTRAYAGIELACLDACGKATGRRATAPSR